MASHDTESQRPALPIHGSTTNSTSRIVLYCLVASFSVLVVSLVLQWVIYADWLHETGQLRVIGTTLAATLSFAFVLQWQMGLRRRHAEALRRLQIIAEMNDRVRNALQTIECVTYANDPEATKPIRDAVESIDEALRGIVAESNPTANATSKNVFRKTA